MPSEVVAAAKHLAESSAADMEANLAFNMIGLLLNNFL